MSQSESRSIKTRLTLGLMFSVPVLIVVFLLLKVWGWGYGIAAQLRNLIFSKDLTPTTEMLLLAGLTIVSLLTIVCVVWAIGAMLQQKLANQLLNGFRDLLERFPVAGQIYRVSKGVVENVQECMQKKGLGRPVLIAFPHKGVQTVGFLTADRGEYVVVMVATAPTPFGGFMCVVKRDQIQELPDTSFEEASKFYFSMGMMIPPTLDTSFRKVLQIPAVEAVAVVPAAQ